MSPPSVSDRAEELLRIMLGADARFRDGQLEAILATVEERARTLLVQRTGWGKSLVYFIASKILRERGLGPTLLISPLLSLMRNQVEAAERIDIRALRIDSETIAVIQDVEERLARDAVDVLLISPERLANERFQTKTIAQIVQGIGLLVIDEAHCISDWGHDFRPDYRRIIRVVQNLPPNVPVLGTTATANNRVAADIRAQLGGTLRIVRGPLTRETLRLQTLSLADQAERLAWLARGVPALPGSGIIYCLTTADCDRVAEWLRQNGIDAVAYHAQLGAEHDRAQLEQLLLRNEIKVMVATVALGMGFDKPDLGFIIHYQRPGSLIAYYQQIGRAGRAVPEAYALLLSGREDDEIQDYFIQNAFPGVGNLTDVLTAIEEADTMSLLELQRAVNLSQGKLKQCIKSLEVDGAIAHDGPRYFRTANPWLGDVERSERVTETRRAEWAAMRAFVSSPACLMQFVAHALDDEHAQPCGRCASCCGPLFSTDVDWALVQKAIAFLRRCFKPIKPRLNWPSGAISDRKGRIEQGLRASVGYALSMWGDAGWGALVQHGKYVSRRFADELVSACADMILKEWKPDPFPDWVTAIPSARQPVLVPDFAARLADALGLRYVPALQKVRDTPPQKRMENSAQQLANIAGAFEVVNGMVLPKPVLLVDDMVDSGWTFTEGTFVLRSAGSGPVYPVALAMTSGAGDAS